MKSRLKIILILLVALSTGLETQAMRWYSSSTGKWLSRDPVGEEGGINIYGFIANDPLDKTDSIGLCSPGCSVDSFKIINRKWIGGWPSPSLTGYHYDKQLLTMFQLVLNPGSDKKYCQIRQYMRGRTYTTGGRVNDTFKTWTKDGGDWWTGVRWTIQGSSWSGLTATFTDEPGFWGVRASEFPIYWGSNNGPGTFDFETQVIDTTIPGAPVAAKVNWGMYIEYSSPTVGWQYYY